MLEVQDLSRSFGRKVVLKQVSLRLGEGVYGLLGPNGSGKTTLMRCLTGVLRPNAGSVQAPEKMGYLPQRFGMLRELTVLEALTYFATLKGIPRDRQKSEALACLEQVHLEQRAGDKVKTLSGGMVRRLGIAQAILGGPELILVDEPTAGLDPEERLRFKNLITRIRAGRTILISTHIVEDVESLCDHIILLKKGRVIGQDTAEEIRKTAEGMVYSVPYDKRSELVDPHFLLRDEFIQGQERLRVLSTARQPGDLVAPTVEDGYMLRMQEAL